MCFPAFDFSLDSNVCQNGFLLNDEEIRASQST